MNCYEEKRAKRDQDYTRDKYIAEFTEIWEDIVKTVYLKEPKGALETAERGWEGTSMPPMWYAKRIANPRFITNIIGRGQKAREARWAKWLKSRGESE